jgi:hypothetical protein
MKTIAAPDRAEGLTLITSIGYAEVLCKLTYWSNS